MYNVPVIKCHVTVMKLLLKMTHLAALQGHVSPHQVYKCLIINIRTGRQLFLAKFRTSQGQILPWKKKIFFITWKHTMFFGTLFFIRISQSSCWKTWQATFRLMYISVFSYLDDCSRKAPYRLSIIKRGRFSR